MFIKHTKGLFTSNTYSIVSYFMILIYVHYFAAPYKRFISKTNYKYFWAPKKDAVFDRDRPKESVADFK